MEEHLVGVPQKLAFVNDIRDGGYGRISRDAPIRSGY